MDPPPEPDPRTAELAGNLAALRSRIAAAAKAVGRDPDEITLIAVTKTYPAADVVRLAGLGVVDIGENRDQEAAGKAAEVGRQLAERSEVGGQAAHSGGEVGRQLAERSEVGGQAAHAGGDVGRQLAVRWHFVGGLQRNKCRSVVRYADLVHSVDSVRLATALGTAAAQARDRPLEVLVQVGIDADPARGGAPPDELAQVAGAVAAQPALRLRGLMAIAPLSWRPEDAFARLAELAAAVRAEHPQATILSAGMSGDLEAALAHGATHLRIGTALLGRRAPLR